jgi:hypothetical protein
MRNGKVFQFTLGCVIEFPDIQIGQQLFVGSKASWKGIPEGVPQFKIRRPTNMKKLKNEKELVRKAIAEGMKYGEERGVVEFEPTDSAAEKIEYIYRLLVHDKIIHPVPQDQMTQLTMKHKLAIWASKLE